MNAGRSPLEDVLNNATVALLILDASLHCSYLNPAAQALLGYTLDELRGRPLHAVVHHRRRDGTLLPREASFLGNPCIARERPRGEDVLIRRGDVPFDVAYAASPVRDGTHVVGVVLEIRDITDERRREAQRQLLAGVSDEIARGELVAGVLARAAERLGRLLDARSCEFSEIDDELGHLDVDTSWRRGEPPLRGRHPLDSIFLGAFPQALRRGDPVTVHDTRRDGRVDAARYAAANIGAFAIAPFVRDGRWRFAVSVTSAAPRTWSESDVRLLRAVAARVFPHVERLRHDEAMARSEARFRQMADSVPHLVWIADGEGRMEFVNRQWQEYTGRPAQANAALAGLVHPDDWPHTRDAFATARGRSEAFTVEHRMRAADGSYRWFLVRGEPDRAGVTGARWFGSSVDIHDLKLAQEALATADRRKDEFLAMLAHELRNPLAPIATSAHLLEHVAQHPVRVREVAAVITRQVGHIRELVDDLLDVSRVTRGLVTLREDVHDVAGIVTGAVEQARGDIDARGHLLDVALPAQPLHVRGDRTRLIQVLANLLNNAAKYSPEGARIDVAVERDGGWVSLAVSDTGQGIDPGLLPHVFELFSQGMRTPERAHGGLGLGLALVRHLVHLHGGQVRAMSEGPGRGSRFVVCLPHAEAAPSPALPAPPVVAATPGLTIALVDDNDDAAASLAMALEFSGHHVRVFHDAPAVLQADWPAAPDVFLLDIGLPGMDGHALARELRRRPQFEASRLVAITGYGSSADVAASAAAGFSAHLVKPVDIEALERALVS